MTVIGRGALLASLAQFRRLIARRLLSKGMRVSV
jgi:hypothetical protein